MPEFPRFDRTEPEESVWETCAAGLALFTIVLGLIWLI